jgi:hypothetical protein
VLADIARIDGVLAARYLPKPTAEAA